MRARVVVICLGALAWAGAADAQVRASIGAEAAVARFSAVEDTPFGGGLRATLDVRGLAGLDFGWIRMPTKLGGAAGERLWLLGGRVRVAHQEQAALFAKFRAGRVNFAGSYFQEYLEPKGLKRPVIEVGATLESAVTDRWVWRLDFSDVIIDFDGTVFTGIEFFPRVLGVSHNLLITTGVGYRF